MFHWDERWHAKNLLKVADNEEIVMEVLITEVP